MSSQKESASSAWNCQHKVDALIKKSVHNISRQIEYSLNASDYQTKENRIRAVKDILGTYLKRLDSEIKTVKIEKICPNCKTRQKQDNVQKTLRSYAKKNPQDYFICLECLMVMNCFKPGARAKNRLRETCNYCGSKKIDDVIGNERLL